jgi:ABC-2 type transport system permease protein
MRDFLLLSWAEIVKLLKRRLTWGLLALLVVILAMRINNVYGHAFDAPPDWITPFTMLPEDYRQAAILPAVFERAWLSLDWLNFALLLLTALSVGQEFAWGTMRTVLARGTGRARWLIARFVALAAVAACYLLTLWIACGVLGLLTTHSLEGGVSWRFLDAAFLAQQTAALARTWLITWPIIALAMWLAVWTRNPGLPLNLVGLAYFVEWMLFASFGLVLMLVLEVSGKEPGEGAAKLWGALLTLIPHYNSAIVLHWGQPGKLSQIDLAALSTAEAWNLPHDPWRALALLLAYGLVALLLALRTFRRKDVTA